MYLQSLEEMELDISKDFARKGVNVIGVQDH